MHTIDSGPVTLACHPQTPAQVIYKIDVIVAEGSSGGLMFSFSLVGDISALIIPESRSPRRMANLWRHTCFETFVMADGGPEYREFNFSPSGEWAVYDFRGYRQGRALENELSPVISVNRGMDRLELGAEICPGLLPRGHSLKLGLSAIVEDAGGILSYWALRHPSGRPDFHHADAFAMQMRSLE